MDGEKDAVGRLPSGEVWNSLRDHHEHEQALRDAQLQRAFQRNADAGDTNTTFASPQEVRHGPRKELPAHADAPGAPDTRHPRWEGGCRTNPADRVGCSVVQCMHVGTQVARVTNEDLEKVAMQIGRNQRVQSHGALLLVEPTFLVRP